MTAEDALSVLKTLIPLYEDEMFAGIERLMWKQVLAVQHHYADVLIVYLDVTFGQHPGGKLHAFTTAQFHVTEFDSCPHQVVRLVRERLLAKAAELRALIVQRTPDSA